MSTLKAGARLKSAVCTTEVIVVKAPAGDVTVTCGGSAMVGAADTVERGAPAADAKNGTALGKRYVNADESLEILCTKAGEGSLADGSGPARAQRSKAPPRLRLTRQRTLNT